MILEATKQPLTNKQQTVLSFITRSLIEKNICPTQREIAEHLNMTRSAILYYMNVLKRKGYIETGASKRSIKVIH